MGLFFLFKQKTAYDVRISYWSSDVCSSDLFPGNSGRGCVAANRPSSSPGFLTNRLSPPASSEWRCSSPPSSACSWSSRSFSSSGTDSARGRRDLPAFRLPSAPRSEEHTSELQSLMRISYAVFCLKKQKKMKKLTHYIIIT